jgi:hypothetical protein
MALGLGVAVAGLVLPFGVADLRYRAATVAVVLLVFVVLAWTIVLDDQERALIRGRMHRAVADPS